MDIKRQIELLLKEAKLYQTHGLLEDSKTKYNDAVKLIRENKQLKNGQNLINLILKKINTLGQNIYRIEEEELSQQISIKEQEVIKKLFCFSKEEDRDGTDLEGAKTLFEFGQFESALKEFNKLIKKDSLRVVAAKNILKCHSAISSLDDAVVQYQQWLSSDLFSPEQQKELRLFLEALFEEKGTDNPLAQQQESQADQNLETNENDFIGISSIVITLDNGPQKGKEIDLDVNYQTDNIISLIIPKNDKVLIESLNVGLRLDNVQFYSLIGLFIDSAIVLDKKQIESGRKKGDYLLNIKILST